MALEFIARKTEHNGAKNRGHSKTAPRAVLKAAAKKLRRAKDRALERKAHAADQWS